MISSETEPGTSAEPGMANPGGGAIRPNMNVLSSSLGTPLPEGVLFERDRVKGAEPDCDLKLWHHGSNPRDNVA